VRLPTIEEKITLCEEYTQLWAKFFNFFADGFEDRKITGEGEAEFFRIMTELSRKQFRVTYFLGDDFKVGDQIIGVINSAVSLSNLQGLTEAQLGKFQHDWHVVFIGLNKSLGRLLEKRPAPKASANGKAGAQPAAAKAASK
jgi:hypothetical protein